MLEKDAELVSGVKAKEELEKTLKAHHIRSQIERETKDHLHMETLKVRY